MSVFPHICNSLEDTRHSLIWSRISPRVCPRVFYTPWFEFLNKSPIGHLLGQKVPIFRWLKFTLKPPYTVVSGNLLSAIWDTSHWTSFVKFGLKTAWDICYDILWPILKYVNFWQLQGRLSNLSKKDAFRNQFFSRWRSDKASTRLGGFRWAGP